MFPFSVFSPFLFPSFSSFFSLWWHVNVHMLWTVLLFYIGRILCWFRKGEMYSQQIMYILGLSFQMKNKHKHDFRCQEIVSPWSERCIFSQASTYIFQLLCTLHWENKQVPQSWLWFISGNIHHSDIIWKDTGHAKKTLKFSS